MLHCTILSIASACYVSLCITCFVQLSTSFPFQIKGEIDAASDSLITLRTLDGQIQRTKKQYQQGVDHLGKAQEKLNRALADPTINTKTKQQVGITNFSLSLLFPFDSLSLPIPISLFVPPLFLPPPPPFLYSAFSILIQVSLHNLFSFVISQLESKTKQAQTWMETMSKQLHPNVGSDAFYQKLVIVSLAKIPKMLIFGISWMSLYSPQSQTTSRR